MIPAVNIFTQNLLSRVPNLISVCLIGSRATNYELKESSDLDIMILMDDTEKFDKEERSIIVKNIGKMVNCKIQCSIYYLTDLWKYIDSGSPITFTMIRDSIIYYDTGFLEILKKLVRKGIIQPKTEAVEKQLMIAKQLMKITYHSVNKGLIQNLEGAVVSSTQSLLMKMGVEPPTPKQVPIFIKNLLVDKNILTDDYYTIARKVIQTYKDIEHDNKPPLSGKELQQLYNDTNKFVNKIEEILSRMK